MAVTLGAARRSKEAKVVLGVSVLLRLEKLELRGYLRAVFQSRRLRENRCLMA